MTNAYAVPELNQYGVTPGLENRTGIADMPLWESARTFHLSSILGYAFAPDSQLAGHELKWITGARQWEHASYNDADNLPLDIVQVADARDLSLLTQELQLIRDDDSAFNYILGTFLYYHHLPSQERIEGGQDIAGYRGTTTIDSTIHNRQAALFAHLNHKLTAHWQWQLGLRWQ